MVVMALAQYSWAVDHLGGIGGRGSPISMAEPISDLTALSGPGGRKKIMRFLRNAENFVLEIFAPCDIV
jgi:hypothetical protein